MISTDISGLAKSRTILAAWFAVLGPGQGLSSLSLIPFTQVLIMGVEACICDEGVGHDGVDQFSKVHIWLAGILGRAVIHRGRHASVRGSQGQFGLSSLR